MKVRKGWNGYGRKRKTKVRRDFVCSFEGVKMILARWLSWLERRPVTAEVVGSNPIRVVFIELWDLSSAGRASALQAEGHRFEPCRSHSFNIIVGTLIYVPMWLNWQSS